MEATADTEARIFEVLPEEAISMVLGATVFCRQPAPEQQHCRHEVYHERSPHHKPGYTKQYPIKLLKYLPLVLRLLLRSKRGQR